MRSMSSVNLRYFLPPSNVFVCSKRIVGKGWRQDATFADSDSCLKPFECVIICKSALVL